MSRRQARELALQAMFQLDFNPEPNGPEEVAGAGSEPAEAVAIDVAVAASSMEKLRENDRAFLEELVEGTREHLAAIDEMIAAVANDWKVSRMAAVDRNIIRLAVFELVFREEKNTPNIIISEAVEVAKKYGTDDSSRFVNGLLAAVLDKKGK